MWATYPTIMTIFNDIDISCKFVDYVKRKGQGGYDSKLFDLAEECIML
jgi:hypothetical protein